MLVWIDAKKEKPQFYQKVFVTIGQEYAVAEYSPHFGFEACSDGYDITMDDDSNLQVNLIGEVEFWTPIPSISKTKD